MKNILKYSILLFTSSVLACGGGEWEGMAFYNLFKQTNISAEEFYPFLRDEYNDFYGESYYYDDDEKIIVYPKGNIDLWQEILINWDRNTIEKAVYDFNEFRWKTNNTLEENTKTYLEFAHKCSSVFENRNQQLTWDYEKLIQQKTANYSSLIDEGAHLSQNESNEQLKMRYYYQIIRLFHYSKNWEEAVRFYENKIENKLPKNEIYYYILDQVAGCYYSLNQFDKAAYLFTKVLNKSVDRKKSAFFSYNFCTMKGAQGKRFFKGIDDEKDLLLIKSLRNFTDEINNLKKFIKLDANDDRVELLFMRALSNLERDVWTKYIGVGKGQLPNDNEISGRKTVALLQIADQQAKQCNNADFWKLISSYLSFIHRDIAVAEQKLKTVTRFKKQKELLSKVYTVFKWERITSQNEAYLQKEFKNKFTKKSTSYWNTDTEDDWYHFINDRVAHVYYRNNELAKAFLIHNTIENTKNISSLKLLEALSDFYHKPSKTDFEKMLLKRIANNKTNFIDYINHQKGVYYLQHGNPNIALSFFKNNKKYKPELYISQEVFSNSIKQCFECRVEDVMDDKVYKASLFSFIKPQFSHTQLAEYLVKLEDLTLSQTTWEAKLAHYLLGNFYYNISYLGYYRGVLTDNSNCCNSTYTYSDVDTKTAKSIINKREGYNLFDIANYETYYFNLSALSQKHYQKTIALSTDRELNARCLYLIAKCELNAFYHNNDDGFEVTVKGYYDYTYKLPFYKSFKVLKNDYSDTKFHAMILEECSYFKIYSNR